VVTGTGIPNSRSVIAAPVSITHVRFTSVAAPQFRNCHELSRSGETRKFLAGEDATLTYTSTESNVPSVIDVASGAIVLVRRVEGRTKVLFEVDVPVRAAHWDGLDADDLPDAPGSRMPARTNTSKTRIGYV
jgi:hypothetical protein